MASGREDAEVQPPQSATFHGYEDPYTGGAQSGYMPLGPPRDAELNGTAIARGGSRKRKPTGSSARPVSMPPVAPEAPPAPRGPPISYHEAYVNASPLNTKSFAARARDLAEEGTPLPSGHTPEPVYQEYNEFARAMRQPNIEEYEELTPNTEAETPTRMPFGAEPVPKPLDVNKNRALDAQQANLARSQEERPVAPKDDSAPANRSNTKRSNANPQKIDWAVDHSPLQRLEVKLNDMSKEQKRAKVLAAEKRAREKEHERKQRDSQATNIDTEPTISNRSSKRDSTGFPAPATPEITRKTVSQKTDSEILSQSRSDRRAMSDRQTGMPVTPRSDHHVSRIPRPISMRSPSHALQPLTRSSSKNHRLSLDSAMEVGSGDSGRPLANVPPRRSEDTQAVTSTAATTRRRSVDDRGVRFRGDPVHMTIDSDKPGPNEPPKSLSTSQAALYTDRITAYNEDRDASTTNHSLPAHKGGPKYELPPQTDAGSRARQLVGFGGALSEQANATAAAGRHHLIHHFHHTSAPAVALGPEPVRHLDEWRQGGTARLLLADIATKPAKAQHDEENQVAWWENSQAGQRRVSQSSQQPEVEYFDGANEDTNRKSNRYLITRRSPIHASTLTAKSSGRTSAVEIEEWSLPPDVRLLPRLHNLQFMYRQLSASQVHMSKLFGRPATNVVLNMDDTYDPNLIRRLTYSAPAEPAIFDPPLYLKCGPLLRYTGMKHEKLDQQEGSRPSEREIWRGSVMIVTVDAESTYQNAPTLRLFHQPMDLLPPPPSHVTDGDEPLPSEYVDPVAGMPKMARNGSTVYVKPAEDFEEGVDYSKIETDDGLFEKFRTANVPTGYGRPEGDGGSSPADQTQPNTLARRTKNNSRFKEVKGIRLHAERGVTFWRFNLEVELGDEQARIAYRINKGAPVGFWVPARSQTMNIMFHSCNGFSASVKPGEFSGPDPLWRDVLNAHQTKPFHVMIGGGDQIYNDRVSEETTLFRGWLESRNFTHKHETPFSPEMRDELENFYLSRYSMWFSQGMFSMANSQIPMINIWDDHDIIDGFGSYSHRFQQSPIFCGLGAVAFKYYMLFQHHSVPDEKEADEPSWLLGAGPGPYINFPSRSVFMFLGRHVAFLGLDCRTERMREEVLSERSYDMIFERCRREIVTGDTRHLIVLLGIPIAYPRFAWLENILTSRIMDPVKALGRIGLLGNLTQKFDGGYEILDDLDDHWTARHHKDERRWLIEELQDLAAEKSVRITVLGGDVHLAAVGQFYSDPKLGIAKDRDHRYMPNVISSAIVNTPPSEMMVDLISRRDKRNHQVDRETVEDMIPMFTHDVDGKRRNNKKLLPRRNWCSICEYYPGLTPPPTPPLTPSELGTPMSELPAVPRRSFSLTEGNSRPAQLLRRLSLTRRNQNDELDPSLPYSQQKPPEGDLGNESYFPPSAETAREFNKPQHDISAPPIPTRPLSKFHRRPTNLIEHAAKKGGPDFGGEISLENGLDIQIHCEIKQGDPSGSTEQYRLLVPMLWHTDEAPLPKQQRRPSVLQRLSSLRSNKQPFTKEEKYEGNNFSEISMDNQFQPGIRIPPPPGLPMGNSVSVESLSQRPRRQSFLQRIGSLRDRIPQRKKSKNVPDTTYSQGINDEYTPNDDAEMMHTAARPRGSSVPATTRGDTAIKSSDKVQPPTRRLSIAQRFGSIGRRLSQLGRPKRQDDHYYSDDQSYTDSDRLSDEGSEHESDYIGSGDLTRPGRQPMVSPPGSRHGPLPVHQQRQSLPAQTTAQDLPQEYPPVRTTSARDPARALPAITAATQTTTVTSATNTVPASRMGAFAVGQDEVPDPFKSRPKVAVSPPPQEVQQFAHTVQPSSHAQYTSAHASSTDAMVGSRTTSTVTTTNTKQQQTPATANVAHRRTIHGMPVARQQQQQDNRRSGGVFTQPANQYTRVRHDREGYPDISDDQDSDDEYDDLDSPPQARRAPQRNSKVNRFFGDDLESPPPPSAGASGKKNISKFLGGADGPAPSAGPSQGMLTRRMTDPGSGPTSNRASGGYDGIAAWGSGKKWWKRSK